MSEGIDYGGSSWGSIVTVVVTAAVAIIIARCLYAAMVAIARCLYAAMAAIARCLYTAIAGSLYANTEPQQVHKETKELVRWKKPEIGWVKLNVDGSGMDDSLVDGSCDPYKSSSAGCGGVIRDARGTWLMGFAKKLDPTFKSHETELQAILTGLELASELASEMNVEKLVVESDNEPAVSMVKSRLGYKYQRPEYDVVQDIVRLLSDPKWQARLDRVPRTANRVANRLAKHARKRLSSHGLKKYRHPPESNDVDDCARLFSEDNGQGV